MVTFEPHSLGDLVTEVTRAYLHTGLSSSMILKVMQGALEYHTEACSTPRIGAAEQAIFNDLIAKLEQVHKDMKKLEELHYSM